jgi:hypothetical protein
LRRQLGIADVEADPSFFASSNNGCVSGEGIADSKYRRSTSAWSSIHQRGKNVGERELREDHELRAHGVRFSQQFVSLFDGSGARIGLVQRSELGGRRS